ncbi:MAG TPA: FAD binding domain-containing protein, partial [Streptosporangiaceae bacterium]
MMKPAPFSYHHARSAEEAVSLLAELGDDAKLLAGGQSLVAMMNFRLARPAALVDISRLTGLRYVREHDGELRIGALALHRDLERLADPGVLAGFGLLPRAARYIGHYAIRAAGTFGGSIAHADPAAEWCMAALL